MLTTFQPSTINCTCVAISPFPKETSNLLSILQTYDLLKLAIHPSTRIWYFKGWEEDLEKQEESWLMETLQLDLSAVTDVQRAREQTPTPSWKTILSKVPMLYQTHFSQT
ncbi:hypothetical protein ARMGADRAFT_1083479 [Armillaria gallica]|uniref:Uncharacterized protein n=1 Tax=Armillaria gallica TaxID=47427 RepID=A0A2H3D2I2_ARMGA|nr:hypothetical protein ARMGADRAFT_1083479 [Armillaria gallica]